MAIAIQTARAKFRVQSVRPMWDSDAATTTVEMMPVYSADPNHENKRFWDATPSGSITMHIKNPQAAAVFEPGREYYVTFERSDP